jgi:hypothetical protein
MTEESMNYPRFFVKRQLETSGRASHGYYESSGIRHEAINMVGGRQPSGQSTQQDFQASQRNEASDAYMIIIKAKINPPPRITEIM